MQRVLSTYLFVNHKLTAALVGEMARADVSAIELFCSRGHFDYRSADAMRELASWLAGNNLTLRSIHSPTTRDFNVKRESGTPLSISDPERIRRQEAEGVQPKGTAIKRIKLDVNISAFPAQGR